MTTYKIQTISGTVYILKKEKGIWMFHGGEGREGIIVAIGNLESAKGFADITDDMMRAADGQTISYIQEFLAKYAKRTRSQRIAHCWRTRWLFGDKQLY